jgi:phage-related protein
LITVSEPIQTILDGNVVSAVEVYELALEAGTLYYAPHELVWGGNTYTRLAISRSEIVEHMDMTVNQMTVVFSNVQKTLQSQVGYGTTDKITGRFITARVLFYDDSSTLLTDSIVTFVGRMEQPTFTVEEFSITATEPLDGSGVRVPRRRTTHICPWFFKDGNHCNYIGAETACNRSGDNCSSRSMKHRFGGFPGVEIISRIRIKSQGEV